MVIGAAFNWGGARERAVDLAVDLYLALRRALVWLTELLAWLCPAPRAPPETVRSFCCQRHNLQITLKGVGGPSYTLAQRNEQAARLALSWAGPPSDRPEPWAYPDEEAAIDLWITALPPASRSSPRGIRLACRVTSDSNVRFEHPPLAAGDFVPKSGDEGSAPDSCADCTCGTPRYSCGDHYKTLVDLAFGRRGCPQLRNWLKGSGGAPHSQTGGAAASSTGEPSS